MAKTHSEAFGSLLDAIADQYPPDHSRALNEFAWLKSSQKYFTYWCHSLHLIQTLLLFLLLFFHAFIQVW